jgi:hypothetical protein
VIGRAALAAVGIWAGLGSEQALANVRFVSHAINTDLNHSILRRGQLALFRGNYKCRSMTGSVDVFILQNDATIKPDSTCSRSQQAVQRSVFQRCSASYGLTGGNCNWRKDYRITPFNSFFVNLRFIHSGLKGYKNFGRGSCTKILKDAPEYCEIRSKTTTVKSQIRSQLMHGGVSGYVVGLSGGTEGSPNKKYTKCAQYHSYESGTSHEVCPDRRIFCAARSCSSRRYWRFLLDASAMQSDWDSRGRMTQRSTSGA